MDADLSTEQTEEAPEGREQAESGSDASTEAETFPRAYVEQLRAAGVEYVFFNPSTRDAPIYDALVDDPSIHLIKGVQEGTAENKEPGKKTKITVAVCQ